MKVLCKARLAPVRRAERMTKSRYPSDVIAACASTERDGFRPKFLSDRKQAFGNLVKGFVPSDAHPLARAARTEATSRVLQAIRMIDEIDGDRSDWTQPTVIERRLRIALDFDQDTVAHMQQRAASAMARAANTLEDGRGLADG